MKIIDLERFTNPIKAIVPIIQRRGVYKGRRFCLNVKDGWYEVEIGNKVRLLNPAGAIEVDKLLNRFPIIGGYTLADSIIPFNFNSVKFKYGYTETIPVNFIKSELWDVIRVAVLPSSYPYYIDIDYSFDTSIVEAVKARFEAEKSLEGIKGVTPELRYMYLLLRLQRDNFRALKELERLKLSQAEKRKRLAEFHETLPGRILKTIEDAGGKLIRFHKQGSDKLVIIWKVGGQKVNSLVNLDFRILEAGFCLEGEDKKHSLSSIIPLAQTFQQDQEGDLYITRE